MNRRHWCLAAVLIGSASATLMQNFITVSLPTIASELAGHSTVGWVVGAYMLASTAVLLNSGRWADRQGPRKVYVVGTLLYAAATVLTSAVSVDGAAHYVQGYSGAWRWHYCAREYGGCDPVLA